MKLSVEERFWSKVRKTRTCWLWTASKADGYGRFCVSGRLVGAHRFAYELLVGPIPKGLELDHTCRVRHCVNPDHLEPVTQRENLLRGEGVGARAMRSTRCINDHEYNEKNTRITPSGHRLCRTCHRVRMANYRARSAKV